MKKGNKNEVFSKKAITDFFEKLEKAQKAALQYPSPLTDNRQPNEGWITVGGSSNFNNELTSVAQWQVGPKS